ncbi:hypothetical protein SAMN05421812_11016 [Asanoa hainanensis]|uniref:Uncharacterized protein n=2 Tax=Asanoa hainanensis TaxID=560556 RepID=A0A239NP68_9ACTN|nr:hypothetical protein SAMN05421812_11016 [Asanoa hainanensis]
MAFGCLMEVNEPDHDYWRRVAADVADRARLTAEQRQRVEAITPTVTRVAGGGCLHLDPSCRGRGSSHPPTDEDLDIARRGLEQFGAEEVTVRLAVRTTLRRRARWFMRRLKRWPGWPPTATTTRRTSICRAPVSGWEDVASPEAERRILRYLWAGLADWRPGRWNLMLAANVVGVQRSGLSISW